MGADVWRVLLCSWYHVAFVSMGWLCMGRNSCGTVTTKRSNLFKIRVLPYVLILCKLPALQRYSTSALLEYTEYCLRVLVRIAAKQQGQPRPPDNGAASTRPKDTAGKQATDQTTQTQCYAMRNDGSPELRHECMHSRGYVAYAIAPRKNDPTMDMDTLGSGQAERDVERGANGSSRQDAGSKQRVGLEKAE